MHMLSYAHSNFNSKITSYTIDTRPRTNFCNMMSQVFITRNVNDIATACAECRRVHKKCDKQRPCSRCIKQGCACLDKPPAKRGRPRKLMPTPTTQFVHVQQQEEKKLEEVSELQHESTAREEKKWIPNTQCCLKPQNHMFVDCLTRTKQTAVNDQNPIPTKKRYYFHEHVPKNKRMKKDENSEKALCSVENKMVACAERSPVAVAAELQWSFQSSIPPHQAQFSQQKQLQQIAQVQLQQPPKQQLSYYYQHYGNFNKGQEYNHYFYDYQGETKSYEPIPNQDIIREPLPSQTTCSLPSCYQLDSRRCYTGTRNGYECSRDFINYSTGYECNSRKLLPSLKDLKLM